MHAPEAGDDAERDRAVAAHDQRPPPGRYVLGDGVGHVAGDRDDGGQIARTRVLVVNGEDRAWQVAGVGDADACGPQPLDQPGGPERSRRRSWPAWCAPALVGTPISTQSVLPGVALISHPPVASPSFRP